MNGIKYSASLANNVRNNEGYCDFEKLESMEGVFLFILGLSFKYLRS